MAELIITKDNYLLYLTKSFKSSTKFMCSLNSLCKISPEFTHSPKLQIENELLIYKSDYSYGKFTARLKAAYFCFDITKIISYETLIFDLNSFSIKIASQRCINKACGKLREMIESREMIGSREAQQRYYVSRLKKQLKNVINKMHKETE